MKKFFALVLALVMALSLTTVAWGLTGTGAEDDPWVVTSEAELADKLDENGYIELGGNIALAGPTGLTVPTGTTVTLDLNGKVLSLSWDVITGATAVITNSGTLTIKDSVGGGSIKIAGSISDPALATVGFPTFAVNTITNKGALTIESGKLVNEAIKDSTTSSIASYVVDNNSGERDAILNVEGGVLLNEHNIAIRQFANSTTNKNEVNITAGEVTGTRAVWIQLPSSNTTLEQKAALNVEGGTLTATGSNNMAVYSYSYGASYTETEINISGGTFNGDVALGGYADYNKITGTETLTITGGDFNGEIYTYNDKVDEQIEISGGSFASAVPAEYCAPGLVPVIENGTFTVGTAPAASGTTGNNSFSSSTTSGVTTSVSAAEKYAIYQAASTAPVTTWTVKAYTTMATKSVTSNGVTTNSYIPAYYGVDTNGDGVVDVKLYEADANSGLFRIFKGDQFVTYVNPLFNALSTGGYVDGDYIADSAAYIAKDKGCGTYGEDVYKINNDKAYAVDPVGRFVAVINGKVAVYDGARVSVPHTFTNEVTYKSTTDLTVVAIECDVCEKVFQVVKTTKLPATYKGATAPLFFGGNNYYILLESAAVSGNTGVVGDTTTGKVESAATFDAGIAMYVGMSVMAAAGSAVVIGKKKD